MASSDELNLGLEELGQLAKSAAGDFAQLSAAAKSFASSPMIKDKLNANLKNARALLKGLGGDFDYLAIALKGAGVKGADLQRVIKTLGDEGKRSASVFKDFWSTDGIAKYMHHLRGVSLAQKAVSGVGSIVSAGIDEAKSLVHKVIELGGEAEASQKGLSYVLSGGAEEGTADHAKGEEVSKRMMSEFLGLAKRIVIPDRDIVSAGKDIALSLAGSGLSMEEVEKTTLQMVKVGADQQSKFLEQSDVLHNYVSAVTRGVGKTTASLQDLNSLRVAKFNIGAILEQLPYQKGVPELMKTVKGGKFNVTPEDLASARETTGDGEISGKELENMAKMQKLISMAKSAGTPLAYSTLFNAAQASVYKGKDVGKAAGGLSEYKATNTLIGSINKASNAFDNLLLGMDFAGSKGGVQLRDFLNRFNAVIGESGTLKAAVTNFTDALFAPLQKMTGKDIEKLINMAAAAGKAVGDGIKQIWEWIQKLLLAKPGEFLNNVKDVLVQAGTFIGQGLLKGVSVGAAEATGFGRYSSTVQGSSGKAWGNLWDDTGGAAANWLGDALAPSQQDEGQGADSPPAWVANIPHNATGGRYTSPTLAVVGEAGPETVVPDSISMGRGGVSVTIPIQIVNASGMDADDLAGALQPLIMREFNNIFQRGAMELGAGE
jgi:hypothetical protein